MLNMGKKSPYAKCEQLESRWACASMQTDLDILCWRILQYPLILKKDNEGPDQPAQMRRLIRACIAHKLHKDPFHPGSLSALTDVQSDITCYG